MTALLLLACLGISSVAGRSRIINGQDTTIADHPHQVSLTNRGSHSCGGSIIGPNHVLTAAHCVQGSTSNYAIQINNGNRFDSNRATYSVSRITVHPNYNQGSGAYPNDVAVIQVQGTLTATPPHREIAMATSSDGNFAGQRCTITGWGRNEDGILPAQLQVTDGIIMTNTQCSSWWGSNYNSAAHICIDNQSSGACNGDSGGPMVCGNKLAGVTSWGVSGCATNYPSVYARVSSYYSWIEGAMG